MVTLCHGPGRGRRRAEMETKVSASTGRHHRHRMGAWLETISLQRDFESATFSCIATERAGLFRVSTAGVERMLGYTVAEVVNRIGPADLHDAAEVWHARPR